MEINKFTDEFNASHSLAYTGISEYLKIIKDIMRFCEPFNASHAIPYMRSSYLLNKNNLRLSILCHKAYLKSN
jgi:hypothetical protein